MTKSVICKMMGNTFQFTAQHDDDQMCEDFLQKAQDEVARIELLLTTFRDDSITAIINKNAGLRPVEVPEEVFYLIQRSIKISEMTQGAFDISFGSIDKKFWNFDTKMDKLPDVKLAKQSVHLVDYRNIVLDKKNQTVFLKKKGMRIGFGGIGKGYAADKAKSVMVTLGCQSGVINASGDLITWGDQDNGTPWSVGIADPNKKDHIFSSLNIQNMAIATSGDYEKFVIIDGKRYSHTIDPKTGYPVFGIKSVTVISPSAELSDALTTPIMVMGLQAGMHFANQLKGIGVIAISDDDKIFVTKNIQLNKDECKNSESKRTHAYVIPDVMCSK